LRIGGVSSDDAVTPSSISADELSASVTALLRLTAAPVQSGASLAGKDSR
jgi:hypothetical protein